MEIRAGLCVPAVQVGGEQNKYRKAGGAWSSQPRSAEPLSRSCAILPSIPPPPPTYRFNLKHVSVGYQQQWEAPCREEREARARARRTAGLGRADPSRARVRRTQVSATPPTASCLRRAGREQNSLHTKKPLVRCLISALPDRVTDCALFATSYHPLPVVFERALGAKCVFLAVSSVYVLR